VSTETVNRTLDAARGIGCSNSGTGVSGASFSSGVGVSGSSGSGAGVAGSSDSGDGVQDSSVTSAGVAGKSHLASAEGAARTISVFTVRVPVTS
jgi:hypothetical protein